ncbi:hypothetical protein EB796_014859 [Bugula neritina]|uniref:Uncharacterized protein n=1 Tax=Bugula neritina TaxID=10212 RepID=A0A7J7JKF1_BUGNE|nr:hypothetical protein EB796_014859 [Bugula neritina]
MICETFAKVHILLKTFPMPSYHIRFLKQFYTQILSANFASPFISLSIDIFLHLYTQHRLQATWRPVHTTTATFLNILLLEIWELARVVFFINLQRKNSWQTVHTPSV